MAYWLKKSGQSVKVEFLDGRGNVIKSFSSAAVEGVDPDPAELERVAGCVQRYHGVEVTLQRARERIARGQACIEAFVDCQAKAAMIQLADFVVARRS